MSRIRWTPQAAQDLESIRDFIAQDSQYYARLVVERILAAVDLLEDFPRAGRAVPELRRENYRELIHPPYRIVYRLEVEDRVRVLTIFRASRMFPLLSEP